MKGLRKELDGGDKTEEEREHFKDSLRMGSGKDKSIVSLIGWGGSWVKEGP